MLDTPREPNFDEITALAAQICGTPMAAISLLDENRQWFKAKVGLTSDQTPRDIAFCAHALHSTDLLIVPDAAKDERFAANPLVTGEPRIRFYAGSPIITPAGYNLGTLCVIDRVPRQLTAEQHHALDVLSRQVMTQLHLRLHAAEKTRAEAALRESESRSRSVFEQAAVGICVVSLGYRFLRVNERFADIVGFPAAELLAEGNCEDTTHPDDRAGDAAAVARLMAGEASVTLDKRYVRRDGRVIWARLTLSLLRTAQGEPEHFLGMIVDVTDRKRSEEERDRLFRFSDDLLCVASFDGRLEQVNPAWTRCLGWSEAELKGRPAMEFVMEEDRAATIRARENLVQGEGMKNFENRLMCKDGSYRWLSWNSHPLPDSRQVFASARDVTERRRHDAQLHLLETCVAHLNDVVLITEADQIDKPGPRIVFVNEAFERLSGYSRAEAIGLTPRILQGPLTDRAELKRVRAALRDRVPVRAELINYSKAGQPYWVELNLAPVRAADGTVTHFVAIQRDISERKRAEEALRISEQRLQFVMHSARVGYWELNTVTNETHRSLRHDECFGYKELLPQWGYDTFLAHVHPDDRGAVDLCFQNASSGNGDYNVEFRVIWPDQSVHWLLSIGKFTRDAAGKPVRVSGVELDITERKEATEQVRHHADRLRESEAQYRLLFADNPHPMWVFDFETLKFLAVNTEAERHYGYTAEEFLRMAITDLRTPGDAAELRLELEIQSPLGRRRRRSRHLKKDGSLILVDATSDAITFAGRAGRLVVAHDITDRVRAENEAVRSTRALQTLSRCNEALIRSETEQALLAAICTLAVDVGGFVLAWVGFARDDASKTIEPQAHAGIESGYLTKTLITWSETDPNGNGPPGRVIRSGEAVVIPDLASDETFRPWLSEAQARGFCGVVCLPLKEQSRTFGVLALYLPEVRPLHAEELHLLRELADDLAFGIANHRVRVERLHDQKALAQQAALLDKATDAIFVRGLDDRITYWNKGAERVYGWSAAEAAGKSCHELLHRDDVIQFRKATEHVLASGEWSGGLTKFTKAGRPLTIHARWTLLRDERGQPEAILAINTDLTEQKKLEAQFLRAQRMESIGTLAGGIAHDLNNLLTPIMMSVGLLQKFATDNEAQEILSVIQQSAKRGAGLVQQVLAFSRGVEGIKVPMQLTKIVDEVAGIVASTFPKNVVLRTDFGRDLALVQGDPTQLNQVLVNLCVNARDAMPNGGQMTITVQNVTIDETYALMNRDVTPGQYVRIEVTDTGTGMTKEVIERIFEPFFTTKEMGKGTGLGLSTVLAIVRSHAGFANVYSELGMGSTFKIYLPALTSSAAELASELEPVALPRGNGELILVVDDEAAILGITRQTLEAFGYRVMTAVDGAHAIGLFAQRPAEISAVLTDMMMPVMDGPALIAALLRIDPHVRIIAASGLHANGSVAKATSLGVKKFLAKPYTADAMLIMLKSVLAGDR